MWPLPPPPRTRPCGSNDLNESCCGDGANQLWSADTDGTLRSMGKCLDAAGWGTAHGTNVQTWACTGGSNQKWTTLTAG